MFFLKSVVISDQVLEEELSLKYERIKQNHKLEIAFKMPKYVYPSVLVKLLLLIREINTLPGNDHNVNIYVSSPTTITDNKRQSVFLRCMSFLSELGFFCEAEALGVKINLVHDWFSYGKFDLISHQELHRLMEQHHNTFPKDKYAYKCCVPIYPLQSYSDIEKMRSTLFLELESYFGNLVNEPIIERGGLADCLLIELLKNIIDHTDTQFGYFCIVSIEGIRGLRRNSPGDYAALIKARNQKETKDWSLFYAQYPDDPFFEVIVADEGNGISNTIKNADHIQDVKKIIQTGNNIERKLIKVALQEENSRLTSRQRKEKKLAKVTGYGAIAYLLKENGGAILFREPSGRYYFAIDRRGNWQAKGPFNSITTTTKTTTKNSYRLTKNSISPTKGMLINCLIPHHKLSSKGLWKREIPFPAIHNNNLSIPFENIEFIFIDSEKAYSPWEQAIRQLNNLDFKKNIIAIDLTGISLSKDILWPGLRKVSSLASKKNIPIFLLGITPRMANRIQDYAEMNAARTSKRLSDDGFLIIGISDCGECYIFSDIPDRTGASEEISRESSKIKLKKKIVLEAISSFIDGSLPPSLPTLEKLQRYGYLLLVDYSIYAKGTYHWAINGHEMRFLHRKWLSIRIIEAINKVPKGISLDINSVLLPNGSVVNRYLDMDSLSVCSDIIKLLARLLLSVLPDYNFSLLFVIGKMTRLVVEQALSYFSHRHFEVRFHQDCSCFEHGASQYDLQEKQILIILDGCNTGNKAFETALHIQDSKGCIVGLVSLFNFGEMSLPPKLLHGFTTTMGVHFPSHTCSEKPHCALHPFSKCLDTIEQNKESDYEVKNIFSHSTKNFAESMLDLERFSLFYEGHCTFSDQHFDRGILLHEILSSEKTLLAEIQRQIHLIIDKGTAKTCFVIPDESSIGVIIRRLQQHKNIPCLYAKKSKGPGDDINYYLTDSSLQILENIDRVIIAEDQCFTGSSIISIISECQRQYKSRLKFEVFAVIDSMTPSKRKTLFSILKNHNTAFESHLLLPTSTYSTTSGCQICNIIARYYRILHLYKNDYLIQKRIQHRLAELKPIDLFEELHPNNELTALNSDNNNGYLSLYNSQILTIEGMLSSCEAAYVEGKLLWLIDNLYPASKDFFNNTKVVFGVIRILSQDTSVLERNNLRGRFIKAVVYNIGHKHDYDMYNYLLETISLWPVHWIKEIWSTLTSKVLLNIYLLVKCFGALHLLLDRVINSSYQYINDKFLSEIEETIARGVTQNLLGVKENVQSVRAHYQLLLKICRNIHVRKLESSSGEVTLATADLFTVLAYGQNDHHQALCKELMYLKNHNNPIDQNHHIDLCMELLNQVYIAMQTITKNNKEEFWQQSIKRSEENLSYFWRHIKYNEVMKQIGNMKELLLTANWTKEDTKEDINSIINKAMAWLHNELYYNRKEDSFRMSLENFKATKCCTLDCIVNIIQNICTDTDWSQTLRSAALSYKLDRCERCSKECHNNKEVKIGLRRHKNFNIKTLIPISTELQNTWIGISKEELELFMDELFRNISKEIDKQIEMSSNENSKTNDFVEDEDSLFNYAKSQNDYAICVHVQKRLNSVYIVLKCDCQENSVKLMLNEAKEGGFGLFAIAHGLDRKGNRFLEPEWNKGVLTQTIEIWRTG